MAKAKSIPEIAVQMRCSTSTVRNLMDQGELIGERVNGRWMITEDSLSDHIHRLPAGTTAQRRADREAEESAFATAVSAHGIGARACIPAVTIPIPQAHRRVGEAYSTPHLTYVVRSGAFVKIGTTSDVQTRFRALVAANPHDIELVAVLVGGHELERSLHQRLDAHRHRDEWFREDGDLAEWINGGCAA